MRQEKRILFKNVQSQNISFVHVYLFNMTKKEECALLADFLRVWVVKF